MTKAELEKQILEIVQTIKIDFKDGWAHEEYHLIPYIKDESFIKATSEIASLIKPIDVPTEKESDITKRVVIHGWKENDYFRYFEGWEDCFKWAISEILKRNT